MDLFGREWCNLFSWTPDGGAALFHIKRDRAYWAKSFEVGCSTQSLSISASDSLIIGQAATVLSELPCRIVAAPLQHATCRSFTNGQGTHLKTGQKSPLAGCASCAVCTRVSSQLRAQNACCPAMYQSLCLVIVAGAQPFLVGQRCARQAQAGSRGHGGGRRRV